MWKYNLSSISFLIFSFNSTSGLQLLIIFFSWDSSLKCQGSFAILNSAIIRLVKKLCEKCQSVSPKAQDDILKYLFLSKTNIYLLYYT